MVGAQYKSNKKQMVFENVHPESKLLIPISNNLSNRRDKDGL